MPEISRFFGIVVAMYYNDHPPPHVHAYYRDFMIQVSIGSGARRSGEFPARAERLLLEWLNLHREELLMNWELARHRRPLRRIDPLE
jgi:hypothetical protein